MVGATAVEMPPRPEGRLAVHLGAVRVDSQALDPLAHMLAVGETLALPVRLLGQAAAAEVLERFPVVCPTGIHHGSTSLLCLQASSCRTPLSWRDPRDHEYGPLSRVALI